MELVCNFVHDSVRLGRLVPYIVNLLGVEEQDPSALVRAQAIITLTKVVLYQFQASLLVCFGEECSSVFNLLLCT